MPQDPITYWLKGRSRQNYGDYLSELLFDRVITAPCVAADSYRLIGSVIADDHIAADLRAKGKPDGHVAFWGCGLRTQAGLSPWAAARARFFGVRGPRTRDVLGLPRETPLGDTGLLLPLFHTPTAEARSGERLCVPHALDPRPDDDLKALTGADAVVRPVVSASHAAALALADRLAGAAFVLAGALHGAVTACAYGVPFAFLDVGYVDTPFKWHDFAASIQVPARFARTMAEGEALWHDAWKDRLRPPPLTPILRACPFAVDPAIMGRAMARDGLIPEPGERLPVVEHLMPPDTAKAWRARMATGGARPR